MQWIKFIWWYKQTGSWNVSYGILLIFLLKMFWQRWEWAVHATDCKYSVYLPSHRSSHLCPDNRLGDAVFNAFLSIEFQPSRIAPWIMHCVNRKNFTIYCMHFISLFILLIGFYCLYIGIKRLNLFTLKILAASFYWWLTIIIHLLCNQWVKTII